MYGDIPPGKEYLSYYFDGEVERAFLSYIFIFPHVYMKDSFKTFYDRFIEHTGLVCTDRWIRKLMRRLTDIENALQEASKSFDLDRVGRIKSGRESF
jgi:hypothetical protein